MSSLPEFSTLRPQLESLWNKFQDSTDETSRRLAGGELVKLLVQWEGNFASGLEEPKSDRSLIAELYSSAKSLLLIVARIARNLDAKQVKMHETIKAIQDDIPSELDKIDSITKKIESTESEYEGLRAEFVKTHGEFGSLDKKFLEVTTSIAELAELKSKLAELQKLEQAVEGYVAAVGDGDNPTPLIRSLARMQSVQENIVNYYRTWHSEDQCIADALVKLEHGPDALRDMPAILQGLHDTLASIEARFKTILDQQRENDEKIRERL